MAQIEFSEEQNMLLDTAGEFCKTHASIELVRAGIEDDQSVKSEVWEETVSYTHLTLPTKA